MVKWLIEVYASKGMEVGGGGEGTYFNWSLRGANIPRHFYLVNRGTFLLSIRSPEKKHNVVKITIYPPDHGICELLPALVSGKITTVLWYYYCYNTVGKNQQYYGISEKENNLSAQLKNLYLIFVWICMIFSDCQTCVEQQNT